MDKRNVKFLIIVVAIALVYLIIVSIFSGNNVMDFISPKYIVNSNGLVWRYQDGKISEYRDNDYLNQTYNFYLEDGSIKKGKLRNTDDGLQVKFNGEDEYNSISFFASNIDDLKVIDYFLEEDIPYSNSLVYEEIQRVSEDYWHYFDPYIVNADLDGDGGAENIYFISNVSLESVKIGLEQKSTVFLVDNNKIIDTLAGDATYRYDFSNLIDINNDGNYELIIEKKLITDSTNICYQLYSYQDGKFVLTHDCQIN